MSQVQQLKDATDIVQLIGERIKLTRAGANYKGLCPFHSEKSPSFFVSEQLQRYRCFGCGENGDALDFLQKYDGMSFAEALKYLSERTGIKLKEYQRSPEDDLRDRLLEILDLTKEYYHYLLTKHKIGEQARKYLKERNISSESIELFGLGWAPAGWDNLIAYLNGKKKYSLDELQKAGLILRGTGGKYYDRFRGRVMFPLKDHRGRVVGFSGRLLEAKPKEAKYINTPETLLYHKSQLLYGFKEMFAELKKQETVIVVEGEFDVVSSSQAHVNNIVAIKGSALTKEQVKLLARAVKKIVLCLDADEAGAEATRRAIEVVGDTDVELRVIDLSSLSGGEKDVDELARHEPKHWRELSEQSVSVYEFLMRLSLRHHDPATPEGKREIIKELGPVLANIPHAVEKDYYIKKLAQQLSVGPDLVLQDINRAASRLGRQVSQAKPTEEISSTEVSSRREKLERYALFLLFVGEEFEEKLNQLRELSLTSAGLSQMLDTFAAKKITGQPDLRVLSAGLGEDLKQLLFDVVYAPEYQELVDEIKPDQEWQKTITALKQAATHEEIQSLQAEISRLEEQDNLSEEEDQRLADLLRQVVKLQRQTR